MQLSKVVLAAVRFHPGQHAVVGRGALLMACKILRAIIRPRMLRVTRKRAMCRGMPSAEYYELNSCQVQYGIGAGRTCNEKAEEHNQLS